MAKKVTLEVIERLKELVEKKFFQDYNLEEGDIDQYEIYEFQLNKMNLIQPSLLKALNRNAKVRDYLELYNKTIPKRKLKTQNIEGFDYYGIYTKWLIDVKAKLKERKEQNVRQPNSHIWALYLGYDDLDEFITKEMERKTYPPTNGNWTSYRAFYYSVRKKETDWFDIKIDFSVIPNRVVAKGWYEQGEEEAYLEGEGISLRVKNIYYADLHNPDEAIPFRIMFFCDADIAQKSFLWGILSGVDWYYLPVSCEIILLRAQDLEVDINMEVIARRILIIRQGYLKIESERQGNYIKSIADIPIRTETIQDIAYLAGKKYLIWGVYIKKAFYSSLF